MTSGILLLVYIDKTNLMNLNQIKNTLFAVIETLIRGISGGFGERLRYFWFKRRFKRCGKNVRIKEEVIIYNPQNIEIGNDVVIMSHTIIDGPDDNPKEEKFSKVIPNSNYNHERILIVIGNEIQIGPYNLISGLGGIIIKDKATLSARVSLYSSSHLSNDPHNKLQITYSNNMVKEGNEPTIRCPIVIGKNSWLGLNVVMYGHSVGPNSFIKTNSVITGDVNENSIYSGNPARFQSSRFSQT